MSNAKATFIGRKWEVNISMDLREAGWDYVDWMHMALDRDQ
jgi:hypothetical protein